MSIPVELAVDRDLALLHRWVVKEASGLERPGSRAAPMRSAGFTMGAAQAVWGHLLDADFDRNGGRLSPYPKLMLLLHAVFGAGAAGGASFFHPAPLAAARWIRISALCLLPLAAGASLAGWERLRRRTGDGRGRAAFWAGLALGGVRGGPRRPAARGDVASIFLLPVVGPRATAALVLLGFLGFSAVGGMYIPAWIDFSAKTRVEHLDRHHGPPGPGDHDRHLERQRLLAQGQPARGQAQRQRQQLGVTLKPNGNWTWPTVKCVPY